MELLDSRRITGANSISDCAGAVIDIGVADKQVDAVIALWTHNVRQLLAAVNWDQEKISIRRCAGGVSLAISAPIDALYAATEINDCAWDITAECLASNNRAVADGDWVPTQAKRLQKLIDEERNPALLKLQAAARYHKVAFLYDDDQVSIGMACGSRHWAVTEIPDVDQIDWDSVRDIPVGLITGTNGKTTSVRMAAAIGRAAGLTTGYSSTDAIVVNNDVVDRGDYAGPEGARTILRNTRVELAVLETARGGLLRRGVNTPKATAALLTRIARDHIGDFGSRNLQELLNIKWVVTGALDKNSKLILNADDERLLAKASESPAPVVLFSLDSNSAAINQHIAGGGQAWALHQGQIACWRTGAWHGLMDVEKIPLTLGGAARHNIANALGAAALCSALGVDDTAIAKGLAALRVEDNPGRGNLFEINGCQVLVDFAHNPDAFRAIVAMSQAIPAKRRLIAFGEAGDRTDELIQDLACTAWQMSPDRVMTLEIAKYARGRERGEIETLLHRQFKQLGAKPGQITHHETELGALQEALDWSEPGDMIIVLSLAEQDQILSYLNDLQAKQRS